MLGVSVASRVAESAVYGLSHARSRELYDLTMPEVRRVLYDQVKRRQPIGRQNLEWILNGHPEAVPLFSLDACSSGVLRSSSN